MQGMQKKGWMDSFHFIEWMDHFINRIKEEKGVPSIERHLLILDGQKSHLSLEVLERAKANGIDMISLPSHTSHDLQSLDEACFKPFKVAFRAYRDVWSLKNEGAKCLKEDLAQWASLAFQKALTKKYIDSEFRATSISPFNPQAMIGRTGPSEAFGPHFSEEQEKERILEEGLPMVNNRGTHYYGSQEEEGDQEEEGHEQEEEEQQVEQSPRAENPKTGDISEFLKIPRATRHRRSTGRVEALVDYS